MTPPVTTSRAPSMPGEHHPKRRRPRAVMVAALAVAVVVGALVAVLATRPSASSTAAASPLLGKPAPQVSGPGLTGGSVDLSAQRGRFVVVNFFASWCPPCQVEEPELVQFAYQHRAAGDAEVLGVVFADRTASAEHFLASTGAAWPAVGDPGGQVALAYGVRGPPETYVVDGRGLIVTKFTGPVRAGDLEAAVETALHPPPG